VICWQLLLAINQAECHLKFIDNHCALTAMPDQLLLNQLSNL